MNINEFLSKFNHVDSYESYTGHISTYQWKRPMVVCKDGYTVSVQASDVHYSQPRVNGLDQYNEVELGFPNMTDELLEDYAEDPEEPTNTVYGYVPVELVDEVLEKHGGIAGAKTGYIPEWKTGEEIDDVTYFD